MFIAAVAMPNTAAAASSARVQPREGAACDGEHGERRADEAQPGDRLRLDLVEQQDGDGGADVLGERREDEQRLRARRCRGTARRAGDGVATRRRPHSSKSSGSVRQISCHSGWKLNQPASGKPVWAAV